MASHEHLFGLGNTPSTSGGDDDDASTSSEDENNLAAMPRKSYHDSMTVGKNDGMDSIDSPHSVSKPRISIKLKLPTSSEALNGTKREVNGAADENKKPPEALNAFSPKGAKAVQAVSVKSESHATSASKVSNGAKAVSHASASVHPVTGEAAAPKKKKKKKKEGEGKPKAVKVKKDVKVKMESKTSDKKDGKVKKEGKSKKLKGKEAKVKTESGTGTNGTSDVASSDAPKKKKTKKKLPKLPLSAKRKLPTQGNDGNDKPASTGKEAKSSEATTAVSARVVASDEVVDEDAVAVATVVDSGAPPAAAEAVTKPTKVQPAAPKRKPQQHSKPVRLPPMTSPGTLIPASAAGMYRSSVDSSGFVTPAAIFEQAMASVGYTAEGRAKNPHRGSSVQRRVGDMFDSDVALTLHFPPLAPKDLWPDSSQGGQTQHTDANSNGEVSKCGLPRLVLNSLASAAKEQEENKAQENTDDNGREKNSRKRQRPLQFSDMIPLSLTLPYPDTYVENHLKYVKEIKDREEAIIAHQEAQEKLEIEQEEKEFLYGKGEGTETTQIENPVKIPPIPEPPPPPKLSELNGLDLEQYEDQHPIYLPKGKQNFVAHLDKDSFHITEGRYFGLSTSTVADPHFVGANKPGIVGLTLSTATGLATSSTSSSGAAAASVLAVLPPSSTPKESSAGSEKKAPEKSPKKETTATPTEKTSKPSKKKPTLPTAAKSGAKAKAKAKQAGPEPNATQFDLRKVMDAGGDLAVEMKTSIIRAAVHASRSGKHGQSFLAPDGKAYPDVSKAFAAHAGLKPCGRCKNNKQGAYHCRLRRKHKDPDYDGGDSVSELTPFLTVPMEDLLINPKTLK